MFTELLSYVEPYMKGLYTTRKDDIVSYFFCEIAVFGQPIVLFFHFY